MSLGRLPRLRSLTVAIGWGRCPRDAAGDSEQYAAVRPVDIFSSSLQTCFFISLETTSAPGRNPLFSELWSRWQLAGGANSAAFSTAAAASETACK